MPFAPEPTVVNAREAPRQRAARWAYGLHLLTLFGIALSNVFLALAVLLGGSRLASDREARARLRPLLAPLFGYVLFLVAAVIASPVPRRSIGSLSELFQLATLVLAPLLLARAIERRRLVDAVIAAGALFAVWALGQYFVGYGGIDRRIRGPFSHWMTLSGVLLLCDLLLIAQLAVERSSRRSLWRLLAFVAINAALLGSLTRSAWLGLGVTLVGFFGARRPRTLLALPVLLGAFLWLAPAPIVSRALSIGDLRDPSNYDRLCMVDAGVRMVAEDPLFGLGPDLVESHYGLYRHPTAPRFSVPHLHNTFVQLAAERGLPALACYLWLTFAAIRLAYRRYRRQGADAGPDAAIDVGVILALVGFNIAGLFEFNWGDTEVQRLALFVLALPLCAEGGGEPGESATDAGSAAATA